jgi:hypothetical protein
MQFRVNEITETLSEAWRKIVWEGGGKRWDVESFQTKLLRDNLPGWGEGK